MEPMSRQNQRQCCHCTLYAKVMSTSRSPTAKRLPAAPLDLSPPFAFTPRPGSALRSGNGAKVIPAPLADRTLVPRSLRHAISLGERYVDAYSLCWYLRVLSQNIGPHTLCHARTARALRPRNPGYVVVLSPLCAILLTPASSCREFRAAAEAPRIPPWLKVCCFS